MSIVRKKPIVWLFLSISLCMSLFVVNALADGFATKLVQIDGLACKGTVDDQNNLVFLGLGMWNGAVKLSFGPSVQAGYSLGNDIATQTKEIMGKYAVTFHFTPKSRDINSRNLKITVEDPWGSELESEIMMTNEPSGVAIEVATETKPHEFHISYSSAPNPL